MILEDLVELLTDGHRPRAGRALGILNPLHFVPALEDVDQAPASLREQLDALDAKRLQLAVAKPRVEGRGSQSSVPLLEGVDHLYRHVRGNDPLRLVAEGGKLEPKGRQYSCRLASGRGLGGSAAWSSPSSTSRSGLCLVHSFAVAAAWT